jgi:hypothetical protein
VSTERSGHIRAFCSGIFGFLAVLAITAGLVLGYATRSLFNPEAFANRAAASLGHKGVAALVAARLTDRLIENRRDLIAYRPILLGTTQSLVSSSPFRAIVRRAARSGHRTILSETGKNISLTVSDAGIILRSAFANHPELAARIPARLTTVLASINEAPGASRLAKILQFVRRLKIGALALLLFGFVMGIITILLAHEKRLALLRIGISLIVVGVILYLLVRFGGNGLALFAKDPLIGEAVEGVWQAFWGGFMTWALVLSFVGLVLTAAVTSVLERVQITEIANHAQQWIRESERSTAKRLISIVLLLSTGTFVIFFPSAALTIFALIAGMLVFLVGLREFFSLALSSLPQMKKSVQLEIEQERMSPVRFITLSILALVSIGLGIYFLFHGDAATGVQQEIETCNGFEELCDRSLNKVVFPAAHNAMSSADVATWMFPNHENGIRAQLQDGIRAFLIDTHYGTPIGDKVKTLLENEGAARIKYEAVLGKEGVDAAMRIRDRLIGGGEEKNEIYLCHGFCELGAEALVPVLRDMREFLISSPNEVVIIINQDEGVTPQSIEDAFHKSGLIDFVYRGQVAPVWPTLREMISMDQRVIVFAENNSRGVEWYHPVFESVQETPYSFHDLKEFSCKPNRGGTSGKLFLLNHWIDSTPAPKPSNAQIVNSYDFLLKRARQCQDQRHLLPNLIAVDFYKTGNLFDVVETLNGFKRNREKERL